MKIRITPGARADLKGIREFIGRDSSYYAEKTIREISAIIDELRQFPLSGRIVPEYVGTGIRERIYREYRIVYRLEAEFVVVITIFHSAKLPEQLSN